MLLPISWTWKIKGDNAISEIRDVKINGTEHFFLIRGTNRNNPVVLFVYGGLGVRRSRMW